MGEAKQTSPFPRGFRGAKGKREEQCGGGWRQWRQWRQWRKWWLQDNERTTPRTGNGSRTRHTLAPCYPASLPPSSAGPTLFIYANAEPKREGGADIETRNLGPSLTVKNPPSRQCHYGAAWQRPRPAGYVMLLFAREKKGSLQQRVVMEEKPIAVLQLSYYGYGFRPALFPAPTEGEDDGVSPLQQQPTSKPLI